MPKSPREYNEPARARRGMESCAPAGRDRSDGISKERLALLSTIRDQIRDGFYNTDFVLEDLSHSFTKAVDMLI